MLHDQTGDIPTGGDTGGSSGSAAPALEEITTVAQPYYPKDVESKLLGTMGEFLNPSTTAVPSGASSKPIQNLIVFAKRPTASMIQRLERPEILSIWKFTASVCTDPSPDSFLACYVGKIADTAKYRSNWDTGTIKDRRERAFKGQVRNGPGKCKQWRFDEDASPY